MNFQRSRAMVLVAFCMFSIAAVAKPVPCAGKSKTCTTTKTESETETKTCEVCQQELCKDSGDRNSLVQVERKSTCYIDPKGLVRISDDDSSYDSTTEMAPEPGQAGGTGQDSIVAPSNFTSALVIVPPEQCGAGSAKLCASNGATCDLIHDRNGTGQEVCRWSEDNSASACKSTVGIWTSTSSKFAKNHPDAIRSGRDGACITGVKNIQGKKAPQRAERSTSGQRTDHRSSDQTTDHRKKKQTTDHRGSGLAAPSNLSTIDVSSSALTLIWNDNSDKEFGVELYRIDPVAARNGQGADWEFVGLFEERLESNVKGTGPRSDADYDLSPNTNYCYRLRAYHGFDRASVSDFSESVCTRTKP